MRPRQGRHFYPARVRYGTTYLPATGSADRRPPLLQALSFDPPRLSARTSLPAPSPPPLAQPSTPGPLSSDARITLASESSARAAARSTIPVCSGSNLLQGRKSCL